MEQLTNSHKYDDIINMPHHVSTKHPQMTRLDRAAQFSPFAALTGYDAAISETQRVTQKKRELDESVREELDEKFAYLKTVIRECPVIRITYFKADEKKEGGAYLTEEGIVRKIAEYEKVIQMQSGTEIAIKDVVEIESEIFSANDMQ